VTSIRTLLPGVLALFVPLLWRFHGSCCIERELELIQLELSTRAPEALLEAREVTRRDASSLSSARRSVSESVTHAFACAHSNRLGVDP